MQSRYPCTRHRHRVSRARGCVFPWLAPTAAERKHTRKARVCLAPFLLPRADASHGTRRESAQRVEEDLNQVTLQRGVTPAQGSRPSLGQTRINFEICEEKNQKLPKSGGARIRTARNFLNMIKANPRFGSLQKP